MHMIVLCTSSYYEDKYFISLFVLFKHTVKIYYPRKYTQINAKNFKMGYLYRIIKKKQNKHIYQNITTSVKSKLLMMVKNGIILQ